MTPNEAAEEVGQWRLTQVQPHTIIINHRNDSTWAHIKDSIRSSGTVHSSLILALAHSGLPAPIQLLLSRGANIEIESTAYNRTPLHLSASGGHTSVVQLLLDHGARIDSEDVAEFTPLILAVVGGHEAVVRLLVERGADLYRRDSTGKDAWDWARTTKNEVIIRVLREASTQRYNQASNLNILTSSAQQGRHNYYVRNRIQQIRNDPSFSPTMMETPLIPQPLIPQPLFPQPLFPQPPTEPPSITHNFWQRSAPELEVPPLAAPIIPDRRSKFWGRWKAGKDGR